MEFTQTQIDELIAGKTMQISFKADMDVYAWVQRMQLEGYRSKGYIQNLIRADMKRRGAKVAKTARPVKPAPKVNAGAEYFPIEELVPA